MGISLVQLGQLFGVSGDKLDALGETIKQQAAAAASSARNAVVTTKDLAGDLYRNPGRLAGFVSDPQSWRDMSRNALDVGGGISRGSAALVGGPVDIANVMMRGAGGERPFGGSQWIEDTFYPPARHTGPETVGRLASMVFNPASAGAKVGPALYAAEQAAVRNAMANTIVSGTREAQIGAIGRRAAKNTGKGSIAEIDFKSMTPAERQAATRGTAVAPFPTYATDVQPLPLPSPGHEVRRPGKPAKLPFPTAPTSTGLPRVAADEAFVSPSSENAMQVMQSLHGGFNAQEGSVGSSFFAGQPGGAGVNSVLIDMPGGQQVTLADVLGAGQTGARHGIPDSFHLGGQRVLATNFDPEAPLPKLNDAALRDIVSSHPGATVDVGTRRSIPGAWFDKEWAQPQGSGAVTMRMLEAIDQEPTQGAYLLKHFDANPDVRQQILAQIPRDERYSTLTQTPARADLQKLRADAAKEGLYNFFARIRKQGGAAGYPALALGLLGPELFGQDDRASPYQ